RRPTAWGSGRTSNGAPGRARGPGRPNRDAGSNLGSSGADLAEVALDLRVPAPRLSPAVVRPREPLDRRRRVLTVPDPEERAAVAEQVPRPGVRVLDDGGVRRIWLGLRGRHGRRRGAAHRVGDRDVVGLLRDEAQPRLA